MEVYPETLAKIKNKNIRIINYNPDHPFMFYSKASGNQNILNSIPIYDLHITYSYKIQKQLHQRYPSIKSEILPFGYELSEEEFQLIERHVEVNKVCFIGYCDEYRANIIGEILNNNIEVEVYGEMWDKFFKNVPSNLKIHKSVYGIKYYELLRKYRVQLNLLRPHNEDSHNMRSFEIPGCGGIMLAPDTYEHNMYFENGREAFFYNTTEDLIKTIHYLLKLSVSEADKIRNNTRHRSMNSGYSYKDRTRQLINILTNHHE